MSLIASCVMILLLAIIFFIILLFVYNQVRPSQLSDRQMAELQQMRQTKKSKKTSREPSLKVEFYQTDEKVTVTADKLKREKLHPKDFGKKSRWSIFGGGDELRTDVKFDEVYGWRDIKTSRDDND